MEALYRSAGRRAAPEGPPAPGRHQGSLQARASPATGTRGQPGSPASAHPGLAIRGVLLAHLNARLGMHRGMQGRNRKDEGGTQGKAVNRVDMAPLDPSSCNYLFRPCFGAVFSLIYPRETFVWHDATGRC